jgi:hypothetical protein
MRFIGPLDEKPFYGVAVAAMAGLLLGGAMKPTLRDREGPVGPQQLGPASGARAEFIDSRSAFSDYRHGVPDWVIGTDWLRPAYPPPLDETLEPETPSYEVASWDPPPPPTYAEPQPEPAPDPTYPSMGGGILQGIGPAPAAEQPIAGEAEAEPVEAILG